MIKDRLKLGRKKIHDSVVKAIRKERKNGMTYAALANKYGISRSYVRYLTLEGEQKERLMQKMRENSHKFYVEHRDEIIPRSKERQRINRSLKQEKLKKLGGRRCFLGRDRSM